MLVDNADVNNLAISVPDVTVDAFRYLLTFLYTDNVDIHGENVGSLLHVARRFQVGALSKLCFRFLDDHVSIANACKIMEQAHMYNETALFEKCIKFTQENGSDVIRTRGFSELCSECLSTILRADNLKAGEDLIFECAVAWATDECRRQKLPPTDANRRSVLGDLLYLIRFPTMDITYYTQNVSFRDILSDKEAVSIFQYFHGEERQLSHKFNKNERFRLKDMNPLTKKPSRKMKEFKMTKSEFIETRKMMRASPLNLLQEITPEPQESIPLLRPDSSNMQRVSRFRTYDGPWMQNGPPDAICFSCSSPIVLYGMEIFGAAVGAETYKVKLYLYNDLREEVRSNEVTITTDAIRRTYDVMFARPVRVPARRVFTAMVVIKGSPCNKGVGGSKLHAVDGITFEFADSNRSSNGTDVTVGQIPALLFNKTG
ncbi:BTB/POZ domain-containing protein 6-like isoform X2 [Dreissena polymorpha]|nr:BTB/POZ domain-containing protein 6-like isoform X2 [Dreissena polymorpha]